ncbi:MAG: hypothetical protein Q7S54_01435 [bacterium]|nr:hypothetical protein [bacterium]
MYNHAKTVQSLFATLGARAVIVKSFPGQVEVIFPEQDGFLMATEPDQIVEFALAVAIPKTRNVRAIVVRSFLGNKPIIFKKDKAEEDKPYRRFVKMVRSRATKNEVMSTKHDVNGIRLVSAENGIFQMWEIAVPTRIIGPSANFFLTIQRLYQATMYNLHGQIYMPAHEYDGYQKWTDLQTLLGEMVKVETLSKLDEPLPTPPVAPITNGTHKVMFFCLASGLGLAQTNQGSAFIHWKELPGNNRFTCVKENQLITGDVVTADRGLQLKSIRVLD